MAIYIAICVSLALNTVAKKILVNQYNLQGLKGIGFLKSRLPYTNIELIFARFKEAGRFDGRLNTDYQLLLNSRFPRWLFNLKNINL